MDPERVDVFPIKNRHIPASYVRKYQRVTVVAFDDWNFTSRFLPGISFCCATLWGLKPRHQRWFPPFFPVQNAVSFEEMGKLFFCFGKIRKVFFLNPGSVGRFCCFQQVMNALGKLQPEWELFVKLSEVFQGVCWFRRNEWLKRVITVDTIHIDKLSLDWNGEGFPSIWGCWIWPSIFDIHGFPSIFWLAMCCSAIPNFPQAQDFGGFFPCAFELKKCSLCGFALSVFVSACQVKNVCRISSSARPWIAWIWSLYRYHLSR